MGVFSPGKSAKATNSRSPFLQPIVRDQHITECLLLESISLKLVSFYIFNLLCNGLKLHSPTLKILIYDFWKAFFILYFINYSPNVYWTALHSKTWPPGHNSVNCRLTFQWGQPRLEQMAFSSMLPMSISDASYGLSIQSLCLCEESPCLTSSWHDKQKRGTGETLTLIEAKSLVPRARASQTIVGSHSTWDLVHMQLLISACLGWALWFCISVKLQDNIDAAHL